MSRIHCLVLVAALAATGAVAGSRARQEPLYPIAQAPEQFRPAIQQADLLIIALQNANLAELKRELARGGPAGAIKSCHLDVTGAAYQEARQRGVAVGRTSDRVRNPLNAPKPWAAPVVEKYAGQPAAGVDGFVVDLGNRIGVLRPIVHRSMCSACHGPEEKFTPGVRAELEERYPVDRARNFKEGELRGWFWVEVPRKPDASASQNGLVMDRDNDGQDAELLADFDRRVRAYVDLHRRLEAPLPPLRVSSNPMEIQRARDLLGEAIRQVRKDAGQGDVFTPPIASVFRRLVKEGCQARFVELLATVNEELEHPIVPPCVNEPWGATAMFSMMPPAVLNALPPLPEELEYRFINRDLVLYDGHANLIVDFVRDAIPPTT
jgi:uncharacterized protein DUF3365